MNPRLLVCLLAVLSACGTLPTASQRRLAVLEFTNQDFSDQEASYLTDVVRGEALKQALGYDIVTKENLLVLLAANHKILDQCKQDCEVETGRFIGADLVVSGSVLRFGGDIKVVMKMHATAEARLLSTAEATSPQLEGLETSVRASLVSLFAPLRVEREPVQQESAPPLRPQQEPASILEGSRSVGEACQKDTDCFGLRFCVKGKCADTEIPQPLRVPQKPAPTHKKSPYKWLSQPVGYPCEETLHCAGSHTECKGGICRDSPRPRPWVCPEGQTLNAFYNPPKCMPRQHQGGKCWTDDDCGEGRCNSLHDCQ